MRYRIVKKPMKELIGLKTFGGYTHAYMAQKKILFWWWTDVKSVSVYKRDVVKFLKEKISASKS